GAVPGWHGPTEVKRPGALVAVVLAAFGEVVVDVLGAVVVQGVDDDTAGVCGGCGFAPSSRPDARSGVWVPGLWALTSRPRPAPEAQAPTVRTRAAASSHAYLPRDSVMARSPPKGSPH